MKTVNIFLKDNDDVIDKLKQYARGMPILVIFDDMINSKSINDIAPLFTVDARHMKKIFFQIFFSFFYISKP